MIGVVVIAHTVGDADSAEQWCLALAPGDEVLRLSRLWTRDDRPICYEILVLPLGQFPGLANERDVTGDIVALAHAYGTPIIYTSGNSVDRSRRVANSLFFEKPYRPLEIVEACRQLS